LPKELPLAEEVSADLLAKIDDVCGRDIKNAVIDAALRAARSGASCITLAGLEKAIDQIKLARIKPSEAQPPKDGEES
jgi:ATP-dependent Zn protease